MNITISRPNGDKIWTHTVGPYMNLPAIQTDEDERLHIGGHTNTYSPIFPPWKIEIEPTKWAKAARKAEPRSEWEVIE